MSVAATPTKLPLARWAQIVGIHPLHFAGIEYTPAGRSPASCDAAFPQYDWQEADRVSREQIALAIAEAEELIERYLGFRLAPAWEYDEWRPGSRHSGLGYAHPSVQAKWGYMISGGIEARSLLAAARPISWSADKRTGTVTYTASAVGLPPCEVEAYYPGHSGDRAWQIRPIVTTVAGTNVTVTFKREVAVKESLFAGFDFDVATFTTDGDFLSTVDLYRHYNDPSTQATLMWEPNSSCTLCGGGGCSSCSYSVQSACLYLKGDPKLSIVSWSPADWNSVALEFDAVSSAVSYAPHIVRLFYYAGLQRQVGCPQEMDDPWARAVTYLALSLLDRPPCDCSSGVWEQWREDFALVSGSDQDRVYNANVGDSANPFGSRRGAVYAWNRVRDSGLVRVPATTLV